MFVLFIDPEYEIREDSYCDPSRATRFDTLYAAKRQCFDDSTCGMVYDDTGVGERLYLCNSDARIKRSSMGSRLHIHTKRGQYMYLSCFQCEEYDMGVMTIE